MNAENFSQYIEDPSLLYQMNYEELRQLILQYPFNPNLRYLLVKKSQQEEHQDFERNLKAAAINSPDRAHLYHILNGEQEIVPLEPEERLELKSLEELDLQGKEVKFHQEENTFEIDLAKAEIPQLEISADVYPSATLEFIEEEDLELTIEEEPTLPIAESYVSLEEEISEEEALPSESIETNNTNTIIPDPRKRLKGWRNRYQPPKIFETDRYDSKALQIVDQSVKDSEEIATETLALLLTQQQQFKKAIEVYERLSLLFPEKSDFFAARIAEIQDQMKI